MFSEWRDGAARWTGGCLGELDRRNGLSRNGRAVNVLLTTMTVVAKRQARQHFPAGPAPALPIAHAFPGETNLPPRSRPLTDADRAAWQAYVGQVAPLPGRPAPVLPVSPPETALPPRPRLPSLGPAAAPPPRPLAVGESPGGVDTATWQRFRGGKLRAARKLDLHGMTAQRAFHALVAFVRSAHADRLRCVEVVTGRGSGEETGILRRELPLWLNLPDLRPMVLGAAHPHAANPGAVRLLLRRTR